jgi:hypothetical protein
MLRGSKVAAGRCGRATRLLRWKREVAVRPLGARHLPKNAPQEGLASGPPTRMLSSGDHAER